MGYGIWKHTASLPQLVTWLEAEGFEAHIEEYEETDYYKLGRPRHFSFRDYEIRKRVVAKKGDILLKDTDECRAYRENILDERVFDERVKASLQRLGIL